MYNTVQMKPDRKTNGLECNVLLALTSKNRLSKSFILPTHCRFYDSFDDDDDDARCAASCSLICLLQLWNDRKTLVLKLKMSSRKRETIAYYRLGKNLSGPGILGLCSNSALIIHVHPTIPTMMAPIIAVFAFQFAGWAYQPPAGDHTCLGYLVESMRIKPNRQH